MHHGTELCEWPTQESGESLQGLFRIIDAMATPQLVLDDRNHVIYINTALSGLLRRLGGDGAKLLGGVFDGHLASGMSSFLRAQTAADTASKRLVLKLARLRLDVCLRVERAPLCKAHFLVTFLDVGEMKAGTELLLDGSAPDAQPDRADRDALTGLLNRRGFMRRFERRFAEAQRSGEGLALLFIDLDSFHFLNDHFGHKYGDELLSALAKRLTAGVEAAETVARIGGDEFIVLFGEDISVADVSAQVSRLKKHLLQPYWLIDMEYSCSVSFGAARYPDHANSADELLSSADQAMFSAKARGRNQFAVFSRDAARQRRDAQQRLEDVLRAAGVDSCFEAYYQPQHRLNDGSFAGAEALLRWVDPETRQVYRSLEDFLPDIESHPILIAIGRKMVDQVVEQMEAFFRHHQPFPISVNFNPMQLRSEEIITHLEHIAAEQPNRAFHLSIEITETALFERDPLILENMARLERAGYPLILDDFGTGYASIFSLRAHTFSLVKIDKSFVQALNDGDMRDRVVLDGMLRLIGGLRQPVLCEGVETESQAAYVNQRGCDLAQGYLYSRPLSREDFDQYLRTY
jgi:diguanylate cyclase (GGDEF)-like protein